MQQPSTAQYEINDRSTRSLAFLYGLCGLLAFSVDQTLNWEFMIRQEKTVTALVIAVPVAGLLSAIAWPAIWISLRRRDIPSAFLFVFIFLFLALFSLGASINRAGESYDLRIFHLEKDNHARLQAMQFMKKAKQDWIRKDQTVQAELNKGGCGPVCEDKKTTALEAYKRLQDAKERVKELGPITSVDPLSRRITFLFAIPEKWIQLAYPLFLPVGIWLASIGFIGAALKELNIDTSKNLVQNDVLPLEIQIIEWIENQGKLTGQRPTQREAAQYFKISESKVSRKLAGMKFTANS